MNSATGRILIADDEPSLLKMLGLYLDRLGYSVTAVGSAGEACSTVEADPTAFAAAVIDGSMPGMSTEDLALRLLRANPALRVLTASGYPLDMSAISAAAPGRVAFLLKPFTPEMLAATLRRLLGAQEENV